MHVRLLLQDSPDNSWCSAHYDQVLMTLRLETSLGSASRQLTKLLSAWKFQGQDRKWAVEKATVEIGSNPNNAVILTWATLLPSWTYVIITQDLKCKCGSVGQSEGLLIPRSSVRFRLKPENSNSRGFELHRPSIKSTKLLLKVIKAMIIIWRVYWTAQRGCCLQHTWRSHGSPMAEELRQPICLQNDLERLV